MKIPLFIIIKEEKKKEQEKENQIPLYLPLPLPNFYEQIQEKEKNDTNHVIILDL